jgi:hypothetical protein
MPITHFGVKTMAIVANRRRKNRKNFRKSFNGIFLQQSSNFFPKFSLGFAPLLP